MAATARSPGWYVTLEADPALEGARHVVYLFHVDDVGTFVLTEAEDILPLAPESVWWQWHGPFPTSTAARDADVSPECQGPLPPDRRAA